MVENDDTSPDGAPQLADNANPVICDTDAPLSNPALRFWLTAEAGVAVENGAGATVSGLSLQSIKANKLCAVGRHGLHCNLPPKATPSTVIGPVKIGPAGTDVPGTAQAPAIFELFQLGCFVQSGPKTWPDSKSIVRFRCGNAAGCKVYAGVTTDTSIGTGTGR